MNRAIEKAASRSLVGGPFAYFLNLDQPRNIADGPCGHDAKSGLDHAMEGKAPYIAAVHAMTMPQTQAATFGPSAKLKIWQASMQTRMPAPIAQACGALGGRAVLRKEAPIILNFATHCLGCSVGVEGGLKNRIGSIS
jgi:hypothetical protein